MQPLFDDFSSVGWFTSDPSIPRDFVCQKAAIEDNDNGNDDVINDIINDIINGNGDENDDVNDNGNNGNNDDTSNDIEDGNGIGNDNDVGNNDCFQDGVIFIENSVTTANIDECRKLCLTIKECEVS